eukprot:TRINITY_DN3293_c0_g1_i6.p1 TRINITY_DN3293_c0_g1~~TRINITY_DN3293_c0_g1_i6.p1  ORF type:complete len:855 (-),score=268.42 TRINITY_DN3293_c0_g1_i6:63-2627(-)
MEYKMEMAEEMLLRASIRPYLEIAWHKIDSSLPTTVFKDETQPNHILVLCNATFNPPLLICVPRGDAATVVPPTVALSVIPCEFERYRPKLQRCSKCGPVPAISLPGDSVQNSLSTHTIELRNITELHTYLAPTLNCEHNTTATYRLGLCITQHGYDSLGRISATSSSLLRHRNSAEAMNSIGLSQFTMSIIPHPPSLPPPVSPVYPIAAALRSVLLDPLFSDVTFVVEGRQVKAHKIIMISRSEYFKKMLCGTMLEGVQVHPIIPLSDISFDHFSHLLEYIYTNEIQLNTDNVVSLLGAADRFRITCLKDMCEEYLLNAKCIEISNACSLLRVSDMFSCVNLKAQCLSFLLSNFDTVEKTADMKENLVDLSSPLVELYQQRIKQILSLPSTSPYPTSPIPQPHSSSPILSSSSSNTIHHSESSNKKDEEEEEEGGGGGGGEADSIGRKRKFSNQTQQDEEIFYISSAYDGKVSGLKAPDDDEQFSFTTTTTTTSSSSSTTPSLSTLNLRRFSGSCSLRLRSDIKEFLRNPMPQIRISWSPGGHSLKVSFKTPSSLLGEQHVCRIMFTSGFPIDPPTVQFISKLFHPNVYLDGTARISILEPSVWNPVLTVTSIACFIKRAIFEEKPEENLIANPYAWTLYQTHPHQYSSICTQFSQQNSAASALSSSAGVENISSSSSSLAPSENIDDMDTEELYVSDQSFWNWGEHKLSSSATFPASNIKSASYSSMPIVMEEPAACDSDGADGANDDNEDVEDGAGGVDEASRMVFSAATPAWRAKSVGYVEPANRNSFHIPNHHHLHHNHHAQGGGKGKAVMLSNSSDAMQTLRIRLADFSVYRQQKEREKEKDKEKPNL